MTFRHIIEVKDKDQIILRKFGDNLLKIRLDKGYSQEELSYECDVDRAKISKLESGKANLYITTLLELAKGLGVEPKELLDFETT